MSVIEFQQLTTQLSFLLLLCHCMSTSEPSLKIDLHQNKGISQAEKLGVVLECSRDNIMHVPSSEQRRLHGQAELPEKQDQTHRKSEEAIQVGVGKCGWVNIGCACVYNGEIDVWWRRGRSLALACGAV